MHTPIEVIAYRERYTKIRYNNQDFPGYCFDNKMLEVVNTDKFTIMNPYYQSGGRYKVVKLINSRGEHVTVNIKHFGEAYHDKYINYDPDNVREGLLRKRKQYEQRNNIVRVVPEGYVEFTYKGDTFPNHRLNPHTMEIINIARRDCKIKRSNRNDGKHSCYHMRNCEGSRIAIPVHIVESACKQYIQNNESTSIIHMTSNKQSVTLTDAGDGLMDFTYKGHTFKKRYKYDPKTNQVINIKNGKVANVYDRGTRQIVTLIDDNDKQYGINTIYFTQTK